jgi:hypothetical protein
MYAHANTKETTKMKTLNKEVGLGRQDLNYKEIAEIAGHKVRVRIKSDSYDFQSYAIVEVFSELKWNQVDFIHFSQMNTPEGLYYKVDRNGELSTSECHFKKDRDALIKIASEVLS